MQILIEIHNPLLVSNNSLITKLSHSRTIARESKIIRLINARKDWLTYPPGYGLVESP